MNFFEQQDRARRRTSRLVALFALAVLATSLGLYALAMAAWYPHAQRWWDGRALAAITAGTAVVILAASWLKLRELAEGGAAVARAVGGRPVPPDTREPDERRLLHVVEEMAIASGMPVPTVFVLDRERGINAFAAGYGAGDAAIAVTRGALDALERDELQGVVAHEFSHVLNGDSGVNVRLLGGVAGLAAIAALGRVILRVSMAGGDRRRRGGFAPLALFGLGVLIVGSIGAFFARLVQAAVGRQREFLADASAVQFTRNPDGIAGALKKIGGFRPGAGVTAPGAASAAHFFFADALPQRLFAGLLATHPPLAERVRRLDPAWGGEFPPIVPREPPALGAVAAAAQPLAPRVAPPPAPAGAPPHPAALLARVGAPTAGDLAWGGQLLAALPRELHAAAHAPLDAVALVYALLLQRDDGRGAQLALLRERVHPALVEATLRLAPPVDRLDASARLPLAELAVPALRRLSRRQFEQFAAHVRGLAEADGRLDLFQFALQKLLRRRVRQAIFPARVTASYYALGALGAELSLLLSAVAHVGQADAGAIARAFAAAAARLPDARRLTLRRGEDCTFGAIDAALDRLLAAAPRLRAHVLDACAHAALADRVVTAEEADLLRAIAESLDCPLPPLAAGPAEAAAAIPR